MKENRVLKWTCYVLIPIFLLILVVSVFYNFLKQEAKMSNLENYFETDYFLSNFMGFLMHESQVLIYNNDSFMNIEDNGFKICYTNSKNIGDFEKISDSYYLIIYQNIAFTNVEYTANTNSIQKIKDYISSLEGKKANIINGNVEADSEIIKNKALKYFNGFKMTYYSIKNSENVVIENVEEVPIQLLETADGLEIEEEAIEKREYHTTSISDFEIYTTYKEELVERSYIKFINELIKTIEPYENITLIAIPVSSMLLLIMLIYLIISIGHSKNTEGIDLNDFDKIPIEIPFVILAVIIILFGVLLTEAFSYSRYTDILPEEIKLYISGSITLYLLSYISGMVVLVSIIKRIKSKTLVESSLTGKAFKLCIRILKKMIYITKKIISKIKKIINEITSALTDNTKLFLGVLIYCIVAFLLIILFNIPGLFIDIAIIIYILYKFAERENCNKRIKEHLKNMYNGKEVDNLKISDFTPEFKDLVISINDISNGFENAKQEGIKSERMKTELITNVSHDIKTPLTSIINYVDLLKKEDIKNKKAKEYIDILDNKSQRLKKLTEDLVEASKASSGNVKLNIEKINIVELIKQTTGEFEDKFKEKKLELVSTMPKEVYINADSRYMYRIIENLFSNVSKYALDSSRVYIDVKDNGINVKISLKNISKEKLNITAEELMQRFVRGDKSRTTEGSGLGLSISQSLTELQNGSFKLSVDGDLFKVELEFNIVK